MRFRVNYGLLLVDFDEFQARLGPMDDGPYVGTGSRLDNLGGGGDEQIAPGWVSHNVKTARTVEMMRQTWRKGTGWFEMCKAVALHHCRYDTSHLSVPPFPPWCAPYSRLICDITKEPN